ncbi:hypothetical protein KUCAC02_013427, partial [Chaenocephalus aceratus]
LSSLLPSSFRAPAEVDSDELLGLEYLFSQSTGESESGPFSLEDIIHDGPGPDEEVVQPGQPTPDLEADEDETSTVNPPAFQLERFCSLLLEMGLIDDKLSLVTEQRNAILAAWDAVEDHDKQQQKFNQLYRTHWGNTLYCRTKRHNLVDAAVIQRVKMGIRYARHTSPLSTRLPADEVRPDTQHGRNPVIEGKEGHDHASLTPSDITATCVTATSTNPQTFALPLSIHSNPGDCWPSTRPIVPAIAGRPILLATSTIARPVPSLFPGPILPAVSQPQPLLAPPQCPYYLPFRQPRLLMCLSPLLSSAFPHPGQGPRFTSARGWTSPREVGVPGLKGCRCATCCGQPTQGHKKYKAQRLLPLKRMSPSKGLENTVYN